MRSYRPPVSLTKGCDSAPRRSASFRGANLQLTLPFQNRCFVDIRNIYHAGQVIYSNPSRFPMLAADRYMRRIALVILQMAAIRRNANVFRTSNVGRANLQQTISDARTNGNQQSRLLFEFSCKACRWTLATLYSAAWQFPLVSVISQKENLGMGTNCSKNNTLDRDR